MQVHRSDDPAALLAAAGQHLADDPVAHTFHLSLATERLRRPSPGRYWWVDDGDAVVGAAVQTPLDSMLHVGPMPPGAVDALARASAQDVPGLREAVGPAAAVARFAASRAEHTHEPTRPVEAQRLLACDAPVAPSEPARGTARLARSAEVDLLAGWFERFCTETAMPSDGDGRARIAVAVAEGTMWVWDDGGAASMLRLTPPVDGVSRLGVVYTPPHRRRQRIAETFTAEVTRTALDAGCAAVALLTQLANPTSNGVYRRAGYRPVHEVLRVCFDPPH